VQEFRVFGAIPEDTEGFLMIRATQPMTFWVDDSTLQDLTEAKSDAPARVGNLIPTGGSFEAASLRLERALRRADAESLFRPTPSHRQNTGQSRKHFATL
jgi:hypothetical protein